VSNHLGTTDALALLDGLKAAVHEFAAREEKLNAEFRARSNAETKTFDQAAAVQAAETSEIMARATAEFQNEREQSAARFQKRKARINQAHMASRKRALDAIRDEEGKRKYKVQEGTLNAERRRETSLADAAKALEDFNGRLAENQQALDTLERSIVRAFRGNSGFNKMLALERTGAVDASADENQLLQQAIQAQTRASGGIGRLKKLGLARMFGFFPLWLLIILLLLGGALLVPDVQRQIGNALPWQKAGIGLIVVSVLLVVGRMWGTSQARPVATAIADDFVKARSLQNSCYDRAQAHYQHDVERIHSDFEQATGRFGEEWKLAIKQAIDRLDERPKQIDEQAQRVTRKCEELQQLRMSRFEREHPAALARLQQERDAASRQLAEAHETKLAAFNAELQSKIQVLEGEWKSRIQPIYNAIQKANADAQSLFPEWQLEQWQKWTPPQVFKNAAKFGRVDVDTNELVETSTKDQRLALPASKFSLPLLLTYPPEGSILFQTSGTGNEDALAAMNNIIFRLLSTTPPGKLSFTIFDPVGLGQNFAGLMHLADYEESHINSRIWTQTNQLEEKLGELNEHMEKVIQMYLRNEYPTIAEYNAQAGTIAEKYHFLVIADFPVNFSDTALRRLINIASSGARCGVYTLIHWDKRQPLPHGFVADELVKNCICLARTSRGFEFPGRQPAGTRIALDLPPSPEFATHFLHEVGESGKGSNRVEVPFEQVAPPENEIWTEHTAEELRVPIGRSGATKLQYLEIGKGTRQHALIAGKTGSGKSTLFHVIITNLALWCSPDDVEFYLVDFKKGVEFKCYAARRLPHGRVVAIESDREFGLSVLQRVDEELRRRGDLFRELGVQDLAGYKRAGGKEAMPRSLLMIDEFQEFFTEEDRVSQGAAVLLDRIVRQGRAFGIHVLLGSQTLGGAYTLARATIGQMVIRIALQCNEADAYLIMDQDNPAPRLLSRPGEGIYNDAAGAIEGNSPFQAVWLAEDVRDAYLAKVRDRASRAKFPGPFVFEGNAAADVRENAPLNERLRLAALKAPAQARVWLGAPNSIKGPTEAVFQKQSGSNLLIVGQSEERALTLLGVAVVSLAAQYPRSAARFVLLDSTPAGSQREFLDRAIQAVPHEVVQVKPGELAEAMADLAKELKRRGGEEQDAEAPETFVLIHGLQNYKKLRQEDEFGFSSSDPDAPKPPAAVLLDLVSEGPARGMHVIVTCDTYNNVNRFLGRKTISEFEMRVLFQMSAADSASLIDEPDASTLGLNRALYYNDREGQMETFRPYAPPGNEWTDNAAQQLKP
jgi:hypothetical protein